MSEGPDSGPEAGAEDADASADAGVDEGGDISDGATPGVDADAEPLPTCSFGTERCANYTQQSCVDGEWSDLPGEGCCFDERYTVNVGFVMNTATGLEFGQVLRRSSSAEQATARCNSTSTPRVATRDQLVAQLLGGPCSPGLDERAFLEAGGPGEPDFVAPRTTLFYTRDHGCFDTVLRTEVPCGQGVVLCTNSTE